MTTDIVVSETTGYHLPDQIKTRETLNQISQFQKLVHSLLVEGHDFGTIPGTQKPTLLKPGAEKIAKLLGLADTYEVMDKIADWDRGLFQYEMRVTLISIANGQVIAQGVGECNSFESRYRYRNAKRVCPQCQNEAIIKGKAEYGGGWLCFRKQGGCGAKFSDGDEAIESQTVGKVVNEDPADQVNTILKMAKKRALVDGTLSVGSLSQLFTQDIEDRSVDQTAERKSEESGLPVQVEFYAETTKAQPQRPPRPVPPVGREQSMPSDDSPKLAHDPMVYIDFDDLMAYVKDCNITLADLHAIIGDTPNKATIRAWAKRQKAYDTDATKIALADAMKVQENSNAN